MEGNRLTPETICSGLRIIQAGYERQDEDFDIVFAEGEYGKGQHRIEVSFCRLLSEAVELLKEQDELLHKKQCDINKLCTEISELKHKFHDAPPKFVSQGAVDQIRWERDTALSQLEQIGKGLGSKMDDIVALLKEQDAKQYNNHEVACILADLFGDPCACNFNDIDTWLPYKCDFRETCCPNPIGVACWEQYLKHKEGREVNEKSIQKKSISKSMVEKSGE